MSGPEDAELNAELVRELFDYDPETGLLTWRVQPARNVRMGDVAGCIRSDGYRVIGLRGRLHLAHRLIWLFVHGKWPKQQIDHKDGVRLNNRIRNLRDATHSINRQNQKRASRRSKTGVLGVSPSGAMFTAHIKVNGRRRYLGSFPTAAEASKAYIAGKRVLHREGFDE